MALVRRAARTAAWTTITGRARGLTLRRAENDRGDVPGWVLVTIMTAGLVAALWAVAGDMLTDAFSSAIRETVGHG